MLAPLLLNQLGNQPCPAGLMACAQSRAVIAMKVFMEEDMVSPVWVLLQERVVAIERPSAALIAQEETDQPVREFIGNGIERQILARPGGTFDQKIIAIVVMELLQRFDQQIIDRETTPARANWSCRQTGRCVIRLARSALYSSCPSIGARRGGPRDICSASVRHVGLKNSSGSSIRLSKRFIRWPRTSASWRRSSMPDSCQRETRLA